jgi:hypothetical protein
MTSMVRTQGQKSGYFFVPLTADNLHSAAIFEAETEDQIRKNGRGGHSTALRRREVGEITFCVTRKGIFHMHLRLHEVVEAGDSGVSFDTCLADEASSCDKESERS